MINCPKCEADNQIGAIFCRTCGEKLDLDEIKPETVREAAQKVRGTNVNWFAWIKNIILLVILAVLVIFFLRLFQAPSGLEAYEFDKKDLAAAEKRLESFNQGAKTSLTQAQVNALAVKFFGLDEESMTKYLEEQAENGQVGMVTRSVDVELLDENMVRITMYQKHNKKDFIKYHSVIEGEVGVDEKMGLTFKPTKWKMGKNSFGIADFLKKKIVDRFNKLRSENTVTGDMQKLFTDIREITVKEGSVAIKGKASAKKTTTTKKKTGRRRR